MSCFIQPFRVTRGRSAFTLVEVVIALGVTTFCIMVLLALLPVAVSTAQKSRGETRAAYLAEQIVSDLRSSSFANATIVSLTNGTLATLPAFGLATNSTYCVACDGANDVLATAAASQYASGDTSAGVDYLVQVTVVPTNLTNLAAVAVEVSAPAQAALGARMRYDFKTRIGNRQ